MSNLSPEGASNLGSILEYNQSRDPVIAEVVNWCNNIPPQEIVEMLRRATSVQGRQAIGTFGLDKSSSADQATLMFDSFSVGPSPNRFFRALIASHFVDGPLIIMTSPGVGSSIGLDRKARGVITSGDTRPAAEAMVKAARQVHNFDRVNLVGPSQGAMLAMHAVEALASMGVEIGSVTAIEPVNIERRTVVAFIKDFLADKDLKRAQKAGGINAQKEFLNFDDMAMFMVGLFKPENIALLRAMMQNRFPEAAQTVVEAAERFTVASGDGSRMTKPEIIEQHMSKLVLDNLGADIRSFRIESADGLPVGHTLADNLPLFAKIVKDSQLVAKV